MTALLLPRPHPTFAVPQPDPTVAVPGEVCQPARFAANDESVARSCFSMSAALDPASRLGVSYSRLDVERKRDAIDVQMRSAVMLPNVRGFRSGIAPWCLKFAPGRRHGDSLPALARLRKAKNRGHWKA